MTHDEMLAMIEEAKADGRTALDLILWLDQDQLQEYLSKHPVPGPIEI